MTQVNGSYCYDAKFAHFMEILTEKEPGGWSKTFLDACEYYGIKPQDFVDYFDDLRLNRTLFQESEENL